MESQRDRHFKRIETHRLVVLFDIDEQRFLIRQVVVRIHTVVDQLPVRFVLMKLLYEFWFTPRGPDEVSACLLVVFVGAVFCDEVLSLLFVPPAASLDNLLHTRVVVS